MATHRHSGTCGSASLCSASLDNMWTCILHNHRQKGSQSVSVEEQNYTHHLQERGHKQTHLLLHHSFRVTWFTPHYALLLKKILNGYLDYPVIHLISSGSNFFYDDDAPLHKEQVVTECFEWHDNNVSCMPSVNRYDPIIFSIYRSNANWASTYIHYLCIKEASQQRLHILPQRNNVHSQITSALINVNIVSDGFHLEQ